MGRLRVAIVGFGRLGVACAHAARDAAATVELAGVVRRDSAIKKLPPPFAEVRVAAHVRDLDRVEAALLCVPPPVATDTAREILQLRVPIVECAMLEGPALEAHYEAIGTATRNYRCTAVVGAGWDPGVLPLLRHAFEMLVPRGRTTVTARPGVSLHHTEAVRNVDGVRAALATEQRDAEGALTRYVYAELAPGADPLRVEAALAADPLFAGERTLLFPIDSVAALEQEGHGILLERRGATAVGAHQNILFEARFDAAGFAARVMLDAAARLPYLKHGAHRYSLWAAAGE
jgi:diaminopimelate dehydrogenase